MPEDGFKWSCPAHQAVVIRVAVRVSDIEVAVRTEQQTMRVIESTAGGRDEDVNECPGIARWKYQDFTSDEEHLIQETVAYTMAALLKPEP